MPQSHITLRTFRSSATGATTLQLPLEIAGSITCDALFLHQAPVLGQHLVAADAFVDERGDDLRAADPAGCVDVFDQHSAAALAGHAEDRGRRPK